MASNNPFSDEVKATPAAAGLPVFAVLYAAETLWGLLDGRPNRETALAKTKLEEMVDWARRGLKE